MCVTTSDQCDIYVKLDQMTKILLVDDDVEFCHLLSEYLSTEHFTVALAHDGDAALEQLRERAPDIAILDVMMPRVSGLDVLRELRAFSEIPVLMLTARGDDIDRIVGLELGADDYVAKPCNPREIVARLRAILRRIDNAQTQRALATSPIIVDDIELRPEDRTVFKNGEPIELTSTEFEVLALLVGNAGQTVTKSRVSSDALNRELGRYDRSIDMHISRLRRKLGKLANGQERIKTVRGAGYLYARSSAEP